MATTPTVGASVPINRTRYTYQSDGLWHGTDGSTKTKAQMNAILASSTGVGATPPATAPSATPPEEKPGSWANGGQALRYPYDLAEGSGDYVIFEFYKYLPPYKGVQSGESYVERYNSVYSDENISRSKADGYPVIALYMPEDISTSYSAKWGGREFGPLAGAGLALAGGVMNAGDQAAMKGAADNFTNAAKGIKEGALPYIGATLVSKAMNVIPGMGGGVTANDILASTRGEILNPNTEVLYQGPDLRNFSMNFKMVARNKTESDNILQICRTFKRASLPEGKNKATNLIDVPKMVKVRFKQGSKENAWISKYKLAAIGNVDVNYTPDGSWSTYSTGAPVAVTLQVQFMELKLVYSEDIADGY